MNTYFTVWHYFAFFTIAALLIAITLYTLQQQKLSAKGSIIFTYVVAALLLMYMSTVIIDKNTKKVVLLNLDNHRLLSTEEIIFTGSVRNIGDYTVGEVEVEIKIMDKGLAGNETRGSNKSTAFEEFFGRNDSDIRPSYMITREVVTTELKPGQTKSFRIPIEYPAYFTGFSDTARVIAH